MHIFLRGAGINFLFFRQRKFPAVNGRSKGADANRTVCGR